MGDAFVPSQSLVMSSEHGMTGAPTFPMNAARSWVSASHRFRKVGEKIPPISRWGGNSAVASDVGGYWPGGVLARFISVLRKFGQSQSLQAKQDYPRRLGDMGLLIEGHKHHSSMREIYRALLHSTSCLKTDLAQSGVHVGGIVNGVL